MDTQAAIEKIEKIYQEQYTGSALSEILFLDPKHKEFSKAVYRLLQCAKEAQDKKEKIGWHFKP